jgi:peptidoglycan hydrolase CwlO-like protein
MNDIWIPVIIAVISGIASVIAVGLQVRKDKKKDDASALDSISGAAKQVVEMQANQIATMAQKIEDLDCEMDKLRKYVRLFRSGVKKLTNQLEEAGIEPDWTPDELPPIDELR